MTCARGCCWTPLSGVCALNRTCACHWEERRPSSRTNGTVNYRDPTADEAIRNMTQGRGRK